MLIAVSRYMKPWNVTHILISSMSTSDLMSTLITCPIQVSLYLLGGHVSAMLKAIIVRVCSSIIPY